MVLGGEREGGGANPRYVVSTFNDLRPQLLAEATKNARATAQQFAADAGAQVGNIRSANQGSIQTCGILAEGFACLQCGGCGLNHLLPFSTSKP